ncbi:ABC transporter permease [Candidatus Poriferisocius sp.]|uniref:ABC transporter permease n=1 Tax=Candidatus Poriferisocius sp. TaxID=3101276 RepID=UPI003B019B47
MAPPATAMAPPLLIDPERQRRRRNLLEGSIRVVLGVPLLLVQLNVLYDSNAWFQVIVTLAGFYALITGLGMLIMGVFGSQVDPATWMSVAWMVVVVVFVLLQLAGFFDNLTADFSNREQPPKFSTHEPLGTDRVGKSVMNQAIQGARVSLIVGMGSVGIGLAVGTILGLVAGYFRGVPEAVFNVLTDSILAFPALILLFTIVAIFGGSVLIVTLALSMLSIPTMGRLARANTLTFAAREFVTAARAMGSTSNRILFREIMPNVALPLASYAIIIVAVVIVAEASLSFLGVGIDPISTPTWGNMISEGRQQTVLKGAPHIVFVPGVLMFLTVLSLNRIGESLRALWDPRETKL